MGRVLSNNITLSYGVETALGVAGTAWQELEPNDISSFGAEITTEARDPISRNRQRRKGVVTDLDSSIEFDHDLTLSAFIDFVEGFLFSSAVNSDLVFKAAPATSTVYTVPALSAAAAAKLQWAAAGAATLVYARGYATASNNGLKALTAKPAAAGTSLTVAGLTAEAVPPNKAEVEVCGIRAAAADLSLTVTGSTASLASAANIDFTTVGLTVGQFVHVGGVASANQFNSGAGFARIRAIASGALTLDKLSPGLATDAGTGKSIDLLFGRFIRNVAVDSASFLERSFQFELASPNLMAAGATGYEYSKGNLCDSLQFSLPLSSKATMTVGLIGTDTEVPTTTRKTGANTAKVPNRTAAFNTSSDVARLRIADVDDAGLTTDFKSLTFTVNNNVSPEKVVGQLGARYMNTGNFEIDIEAQLLFTNADVVTRIRENTTVSMDFALNNDDGAIVMDVPSMTLGGGGREYPRNESVRINTTGQAFGDPTLGTSLSASLFPVVP